MRFSFQVRSGFKVSYSVFYKEWGFSSSDWTVRITDLHPPNPTHKMEKTTFKYEEQSNLTLYPLVLRLPLPWVILKVW